MAAETRYPSAYPADVDVAQTGRRSRVSWGAILAGFFCALAIQAVLTMVGLAWGFGTIDPTEEARPLAGLATGGGVYWTITSIVSLFIGGWIAARLAAVPFTISSVIHGISVWALTTIVLVFLLMSAIGMAMQAAATTARVAAQAATATGQAAANLAQNVDVGQLPMVQQIQEAARQRDLTAQDIQQELQQIYNEVVSEQEQERAAEAVGEAARQAVRRPAQIPAEVTNVLDRLVGGPQAVFNEQDRQELVSVMSERFDMSEQEAEQIVNRWQQQWQQAAQQLETQVQKAQQQAAQAAESTAEAAANTSIAMAIASLLGLIAAAGGAAVGRIGSGSRHHY
ncbi:MAG: hypothetical protein ACLFV8_13745 [Alphaproteobacteria bacterium]